MDDAPSYAALHELVAQYRGGTARTVYLEKPGLVPTHRWRPEHPHAAREFHDAGALAALAFKPETGRA
ncbi:hypothetical protein [Streptomyces griseofuscus]|uniref:hypothetical protein n=1 Tax=Streptomyces griseofuscus TaxID=146922 RepID=UPI003405E32B